MNKRYENNSRFRDTDFRKQSLERKYQQSDKRESRNQDERLALNLDLSLEDDTIEFSIDEEIQHDISARNNEKEISARGVFVHTPKTFLPAPEGRSIKKSNTIKKEIIKFRCTVFEKKVLKIKAKKSGLTLSEYCRKVAFQEKITERLTDEQIDIYKMLMNYHNNFIRIGNMYHKKNPKLTKTVIQLTEEIKMHLKKFK